MSRFFTATGLILIGLAIFVWWAVVPRDSGLVTDVLPAATVPLESSPVTQAPSVSTIDDLPAQPGGAKPVGIAPVTRAALGADEAPDREVQVPTALSIPSIGVDAAVVPLGVDKTGAMDIPRDVAHIGWYRHGALPGDEGSAVFAGHVDSARQGAGAFFRLGTLRPGAHILVESDSGISTFVVAAVQTIGKGQLPLDRIFSRTGQSVITLITCGGEFSAADGAYDSNVVVVARPLTEVGLPRS